MGRPLLVFTVLSALAVTSGCASMTRERCGVAPAPAAGTFGDAPVEPLTERDVVLVKRLVRSLAQDDFPAFERLQPTESQYVTLAWRFGAARADELMAFVRDRQAAQAHFAAVRAALTERGLDARTAPRCTRRYHTRPDEQRIYMIDVALGDADQAVHLTAEVLDSSGHASLIGPVTRDSLAGLIDQLFDLAEGYLDVIEAAPEPAAALTPARAYVTKHAARYRSLQQAINEAIPSAGAQSGDALQALTRRTIALSVRWQQVAPALTNDPAFLALMTELGAPSGVGALAPSTWSDEPELTPPARVD